MTRQLAELYPSAEVTGVDLSDVPKREGEELPPNLTFVKGEIRALMSGDDARFKAGKFDYVYSRMLLVGMTDWPDYIARVFELLRLGGWAEIQDLDARMRDGEEKVFGLEWAFYAAWREGSLAKGMDLEIGSKLESLLEGAGFEDVEGVYRPFAYREIPGCPEARLMVESNRRLFREMMPIMIRGVTAGRYGEEEVEGFCREAVRQGEGFVEGDHMRFCVAVGRKGVGE